MNLKSRSLVTLFLLALTGLALTGCEASVGTPSDKEQLQTIITKQLPGKLEGQVDSPKVTSVTCVQGESNKYDCVAALTYVEDGKAAKADISISGSCDEKSCVWETKD